MKAEDVAVELVSWLEERASDLGRGATEIIGKIEKEIDAHVMRARADAARHIANYRAKVEELRGSRLKDTEMLLNLLTADLDALEAMVRGGPATPIDMILRCPACTLQHIDAPSEGWGNPPHRSHLCHGCKHIWRPADVPTNGVAEIRTRGEDDTEPRPVLILEYNELLRVSIALLEQLPQQVDGEQLANLRYTKNLTKLRQTVEVLTGRASLARIDLAREMMQRAYDVEMGVDMGTPTRQAQMVGALANALKDAVVMLCIVEGRPVPEPKRLGEAR